MKRTLLSELKENEETKISGFIERIRDTKYMLFVIVKDRTGFIQVSLDKNMRLANGNELTDSMNERMYFAYYEDESGNKDWKLVNMQSLGKNK